MDWLPVQSVPLIDSWDRLQAPVTMHYRTKQGQMMDGWKSLQWQIVRFAELKRQH